MKFKTYKKIYAGLGFSQNQLWAIYITTVKGSGLGALLNMTYKDKK
ncbi:MAG: hypothetical protein JHC37_06870 [Campylobacteraceae bacterium]|jgi:hypothetical protein|nr:hypothetical protein [Campylobacteraceae bacterium]